MIPSQSCPSFPPDNLVEGPSSQPRTGPFLNRVKVSGPCLASLVLTTFAMRSIAFAWVSKDKGGSGFRRDVSSPAKRCTSLTETIYSKVTACCPYFDHHHQPSTAATPQIRHRKTVWLRWIRGSTLHPFFYAVPCSLPRPHPARLHMRIPSLGTLATRPLRRHMADDCPSTNQVEARRTGHSIRTMMKGPSRSA
jgi:hypothetical protein